MPWVQTASRRCTRRRLLATSRLLECYWSTVSLRSCSARVTAQQPQCHPWLLTSRCNRSRGRQRVPADAIHRAARRLPARARRAGGAALRCRRRPQSAEPARQDTPRLGAGEEARGRIGDVGRMIARARSRACFPPTKYYSSYRVCNFVEVTQKNQTGHVRLVRPAQIGRLPQIHLISVLMQQVASWGRMGIFHGILHATDTKFS